MKHPYHSLLPVQLQNVLMQAAERKRLDLLDETIQDVQRSAPSKFHTAKTLDQRRFYNEPRQVIPNAGFINPVPHGMSRV